MKFLKILSKLFLITILAFQYGQTQTYQDCDSSFPICESKSYHIKSMKGYGDKKEVFEKSVCTSTNFKETNSYWLKWKIKESGIISFVINPNDVNDDIDFILFEGKEKNDCNNMETVRCMASGVELGSENRGNSSCIGATGLKLGSIDEFESQGCKFNSDNYLKYLDAKKGEEYFLFINNYNSSNGFSISFEGTADFHEYDHCPMEEDKDHATITSLYPNPANSIVYIDIYSKKEQSSLIENGPKIDIIDFSGKIVKTLSPKMKSGINTIILDVENLPNSTYVVRLTEGNFITTKLFAKIN